MSTALQYEGRTIDLLLWDGIQENKEVQLVSSLGGVNGGGKIVTGIQKLAQKFLKVLLQEVGTKTYAPTEGTKLVTLIRQGQIRTSLDAQQAFAAAQVLVKRQLNAWVTPTTPLDEQFGSATLLTTYLQGNTIAFQIQLSSLAGDSVVFIQPLTVSPSSRYNVPA